MLTALYSWFGKKTVIAIIAIIVILISIGLYLSSATDQNTEEAADSPPLVAVATVANLSSQNTLAVVGTVEAVDQAELKSEVGGRVTVVNSALGQQVGAGRVIAQLENANERAAVLQAEGAYEASLASANQSDLSVEQAETNLATAKNNLEAAENAISNLNRSSLSTSNQIVSEVIDPMFSNPRQLQPRLRVDIDSNRVAIESQRLALRSTFTSWNNTLTDSNSAEGTLEIIRDNSNQLLDLVLVLIEELPDADPSSLFSQAELNVILSELNTARAQLNNIVSSVDTNRTALTNSVQSIANATDALEQARIGGTSGDVSSANAQVKQALGSLRNAQANLAKTIITTPIAGELIALNVKVGDFIGAQAPIATVANNKALEITAFVGESDRRQLEVGQSVLIDSKHEGVVTAIASALNPTTKKFEVKIATETDLVANGDTVLVETVASDGPSKELTAEAIFVPITAVKFTNTDAAVFVVSEAGLLESLAVETNRIAADSIEITAGIDATSTIVVDARGLVVGQEVETVTQ